MNFLRKSTFMVALALILLMGPGNYFTPTIFAAPGPALTTTGGSASFVEADNTASTPVVIDSGITVTDGSSTTLESATVAITSGLQSGEDVLGFTNDGTTMGNIDWSYNAATGVLTLTSAGATATLAQWQSALRSITFTNTAFTPNTTTRTISFTAIDGAGNTSNTVARTVTVTATDQTPIVTMTGGTTDYAAGTAAVIVNGTVTVSDNNDSTQSSGIVSVSSGFHSGDTLTFVNTNSTTFGNIVGSYNTATGVLTLTSSGAATSNAQWSNALSAVMFSTANGTPSGIRTISFAVSDGTKTSDAKTSNVNVTGTLQLTVTSGSASFVSGDNIASTPVVIDSGITVTGGSSTTLASATVAITGNLHSGEDVLEFTNDRTTMGNIDSSYNAATGVLTLTSAGATATLTQWQSALRSITFTNTATTPNTTTRTIGFTVVDGAGNASNTVARTVTVTATDQTPIVSMTNGTTDYTAGTAAVIINEGVTVSDLDNSTQSSGTVSIASGFHSGDTLTFVNTNSTTFGNIVGSYNTATGVLTLTSSGAVASNAQWSNALSAVAFSTANSTPNGMRTISFAVNDGTKTSATKTSKVNVVGLPSLTTTVGPTSFVSGDNIASTPVVIDSGITVTGGSSTTLASATVAITGNLHSGEDVLEFTNDRTTMGNIDSSYNAATGVLTLTSAGATATLAQWQSALGSITYTDSAITPDTSTRTISFTVVDGAGNTSNTATKTVTVTAIDQTPIVTTTGGTTDYVAGTLGVAIDSGIRISDRDHTTLVRATVSVSSGFQNGDILSFIATGPITGSYNTTNGVLTMTAQGGATLAQWQSALNSVSFYSSGSTGGLRTISYTVNDGLKSSRRGYEFSSCHT
ncbi:hypothetical protein LJK87_29085 [Paenibacillus sp. P25]|nr:hypothetical protein LJK87_29085 [Paenibacillus sp. P25]